MPEKINSFKELENQQEKEYAQNLNSVKQSLDSNLSGLSFFTNVIDVYFAKVLSYIVTMTGGSEEKDEME